MNSAAQPTGATPRVLVVDDEIDLLDLARMLLEPQGYEVHTAVNGHEGLAAARTTPYDVIVLDITMPVMDGIALGHALRAEPMTRDTTIVVHSALSEHWLRGFFTDYDVFLPKPAAPGELVAVVAQMLVDNAQRARGARAIGG